MFIVRRINIYCSVFLTFILLIVPSPFLVHASQPVCKIQIDADTFNCSLGRSGLKKDKQEGDGATPIGEYYLRRVFYRPDRIKKDLIQTQLPLTPLQKNDGWCDDANAFDYNRLIKLPFRGSYEKLWRLDHVYDIIVIVGYNDNPPVKGKGSAIFMHIAKENYQPTSGCIALKQKDLLTLLKKAGPRTKIQIAPDSIKLLNEGKS